MRRFRFLFLCLTTVLFCACSRDEGEMYPHTLETEGRFSKKIDANLSLECLRPPQNLVAGKSGQTVRFILRNRGLAPVDIEEWYATDSDNVRVFYAVCEKGKSANVQDPDWKQGWPLPSKKPRAKGRRQSICVNPSTQGILLDVPMEFLKDYKIHKPVETLAVYVELSLQSVPLRSPVYEMDVRPVVHQY